MLLYRKYQTANQKSGHSFVNVGDGVGTATIGPERAMFGFSSSETLRMQAFSVVYL